VNALVHAYNEGTFEHCLCPREALEAVLADRPEDAAENLSTWRQARAAVGGADQVRIFRRLGVNLAQPLEGVTWGPWTDWIGLRFAEVAADPATLEPDALQPLDYAWRRRRSSFPDDAARRRAVELVLTRRAEDLQAWLDEGSTGTTRLRLAVETGERVGEVAHLSDERDDPTPESVTAGTGAGVLVRRGPEAGGYEVVGADVVEPDDPAAAGTRERFPLVHALLGGWFGSEELEHLHPWQAQQLMLQTEDDGVLAEFAGQLRQLLTADEEGLAAAVEASGCYVQPPHLRLWLTWMAWRIETFDWKPAV
jgi:hypothetical protein